MDAKVVTIKFPLVLKPGTDTPTIDLDNFYFAPELLGWKFASVETPDLTDQIAQAIRFGAALEKWIKAAKVAYQTKIKAPENSAEPTVTQGNAFQSVFSYRERFALDQEKVKTEMGEEWYNAHCKTTQYYELRFKPIGVQEEKGGEDTTQL